MQAEAFHYPAAAAVQALYVEVPGYRVALGLDRKGRVVGVVTFPGNSTGFPAVKMPKVSRPGWLPGE